MNFQIKNKKGISLMISYVLLVVIAVGLSVAVYSYLKLYLPAHRVQCTSDVVLVIEEATCKLFSSGEKELTVRLSNRGLFNASAAYIRMGKEYQTVKMQVNQGQEILVPRPISPEESRSYGYNITKKINASGVYILEVQPAVLSENILVPCPSIVTQAVNCTTI